MCNAFLFTSSLSLSSGIIKEIFCVHSSLAKEPDVDEGSRVEKRLFI